jgi:hypothetical protein
MHKILHRSTLTCFLNSLSLSKRTGKKNAKPRLHQRQLNQSSVKSDVIINRMRGSAILCSVKVDIAFLREHAIFDPIKLTPLSVDMKICSIDFVGEIPESDKFGWNLSARGRSAHTCIRFCDCLSIFLRHVHSSTGRTVRLILTVDGLTDAN